MVNIKQANGSSRSRQELQAQATAESESSEDNCSQESDEEYTEEEHQNIASLLLMHAYHLPGNSWTQDLWQYLTNNHPILGICLHHRLHPLSWKMRVAYLIGSILFGLALTNIVYLVFVFVSEDDAFDKEYITLETNATRTGLYKDFDDTVSSLSVTNGNIVLWTVGALIHGLYDNTIWALATCQCCGKPNGKKDLRKTSITGSFLIMLSVVVVSAVASFAVMLRAALDADSTTTTTNVTSPNIMDSHNQVHAQFEVLHQREFQDYEFILSYFVELVLSYVVYYPVAGVVLFSGITSCGRFPILGGRPYEIRQALEAHEEDDLEQGVEVAWKSSRLNAKNNASASDPSESSTFSDDGNDKADF